MSHDRISDRARWWTCVHEAGHVAAAIMTRTPVIRASAYRHYSTAARQGVYGYATLGPADSEARDLLVRAAGGVAERLLTDAPVRKIVHGCTDDVPLGSDLVQSHGLWDLCADIVLANEDGVLRVAKAICEGCGRVPGDVLEDAFLAR